MGAALLARNLALRRARRWTRPPQWEVPDWKDELESVANLAFWGASTTYDSSRGVPFPTYVYRTVLQELWQFYRTEWRFARNNVSGCGTLSDLSGCMDPAAAEARWAENDSLRAGLASLPEQYRSIIILPYYKSWGFRSRAMAPSLSPPTTSKGALSPHSVSSGKNNG